MATHTLHQPHFRLFYMEVHRNMAFPTLPLMFYSRFGEQLGNILTLVDAGGNTFYLLLSKAESQGYIVYGLDDVMNAYGQPLGCRLKLWYSGNSHFMVKVRNLDNVNLPLPLSSPIAPFNTINPPPANQPSILQNVSSVASMLPNDDLS